MSRLSKWIRLPVAAATALSVAVCWAAFPERGARIVVPFSPGASTDIVARLLAERFTALWNQPVIVENRVGAGGIIGADFVAKSAPDGYTMLMGSEAISLLPSVQDLPFDWRTDLKRVSLAATVPILLVATAKRNDIGSLAELVRVAKANQGKLNYGTPGKATVQHLATELFARSVGIELTHVPFKGAGPALTDLIAGHIDIMFGAEPSAKGHVNAGRLKALAVLSSRRLAGMPNVPTAAEAGYPFEEFFWFGLMVPGKTPPEVVQQISSAAVRVLKEPELRKRMTGSGLTAVGNSPEEFESFFRGQFEKWAKTVGSMKIKLQ
ncbi:MAG: tripartite tricarboxylate transporter substrate binding protein [Betaproteobacteria bacterium]|nr:tripartite tricarboxylate transporter substrate binding protein [Betaproteobacteria bacterium]